jgi:hypothetical protein
MRRHSTIISLPSLLILAFLLAVLGLTLWQQGGLAFSPGDLSEAKNPEIVLGGYSSHADFEDKCSLCHQPLNNLQAVLCIDCHSNINEQVMMPESLHGSFENGMQCAECHPDHRGRDHDLRLGSLENFDHSALTFSLIWHQVDYSIQPIECLDCHVSDDQFSVLDSYCTDCHLAHNEQFMLDHETDFRDGCVNCHDGLDSMARFDHANSEFLLAGSHQDLACAQCHIKGEFQGLESECQACHVEPAEHLGMFGLDCAACHGSQAWKPADFNGALFDHDLNTGFDLELHRVDFAGEPIACQDCHLEGNGQFSPDTCFNCHADEDRTSMVNHQVEMGSRCLECHDGTDRMQNFDHQDIYPLDGMHLEINCQNCHVNQVYQGTPNECKDCHPEPEIHQGFFGLTCEYCHETSSWYPARLQKHLFPIDHGGEAESECQACHLAAYDEYTCYACHEHSAEDVQDEHRDLGLPDAQLRQCVECHLDGRVHELDERED